MAAFTNLGGKLLHEDGGFLLDDGGLLLWMSESQIVLFGDKDFKPLLGWKETIEWKTDVIQTKNGEQRIAIRTAPRTIFEARAYLNEINFRQVKSVLRSIGTNPFIVPLWLDITDAGSVIDSDTTINVDTTNQDYKEGDYVGLLTSDDVLIVKEILSVTSSSIELVEEVGVEIDPLRILPMVTVIVPEGVSIQRGALNNNFMSLKMLSVNNKDLSTSGSFTQYKGLDVLLDCQPLLSGINESIVQSVDVFDSGTGKVEYDTQLNYLTRRMTCNFIKLNSVSRHTLRKFLHKMKGRRGAFWLPTFHNDMELNANITSGTNYMDVKSFFYGSYIGENEYSDILIEMKNGTRYFNRILSSTNNDVVERFTMENNWSANVVIANVKRIMFIHKVRFDSDSAEFNYVANQITTLSMPVVEVIS